MIFNLLRELGERDLEAARKIINKVCLDQVRLGFKAKVDNVRSDLVFIVFFMVSYGFIIKSCINIGA